MQARPCLHSGDMWSTNRMDIPGTPRKRRLSLSRLLLLKYNGVTQKNTPLGLCAQPGPRSYCAYRENEGIARSESANRRTTMT